MKKRLLTVFLSVMFLTGATVALAQDTTKPTNTGKGKGKHKKKKNTTTTAQK